MLHYFFLNNLITAFSICEIDCLVKTDLFVCSTATKKSSYSPVLLEPTSRALPKRIEQPEKWCFELISCTWLVQEELTVAT